MAVEWMDFPSGSQGLYGDQEDRLTDGVYSVQSGCELAEDPDPNVTGRVLRYDDFSQDATKLRKVLAAEQTTVGFAFRQWKTALQNTSWGICLNNAGASRQVSITTDSSGRLLVKTGSPRTGSVIGTSALNTIVANAWQHIECRFTAGAGTGSFEIRVEGVTVLNISSVDTGAGPYAQLEFTHTGNNTSSGNFYFKDFVIWNGSGGWGDSFVGSVQVFDLRPNADVSTGWSRTTGTTDWEILDNTPPVDTSYIFAPEDPSIPAPSITQLTNLPEDVTSVRALMMIGRMRKSDGGDAQVQMSLLSNGDADNGADRPVTTAFTYWYDISHLDPDTAAPWTPAGVDNAQFQINRTV
jgi:hypothetical protein